MNGYMHLSMAIDKTGKKRSTIEFMMKSGKIRFKKTTDIAKKKPVVWVSISDLEAASDWSSLSFMAISDVPSEHPMSQRMVRYLIANGRLRWVKREKRKLVCVEDVKQYLAKPASTISEDKRSKR